MPVLNNDIFYDIAKTVVEDGDQHKVYLFALSGKQCFQALKDVFDTVSYLELFQGYYIIGWDKKFCKFDVSDKPHSKSVMDCIGYSVEKLLINSSIDAFYAPIMQKIIQGRKLISLCINKKAEVKRFPEIITACAGTLKELSAPIKLMKIGKNSTALLKLDSFTFYEAFSLQQLFYCCKTTKLVLYDDYKLDVLYEYQESVKKNQSLSAVNVVTFNIFTYREHLCSYDPDIVMRTFPSLEHLTFKTSFHSTKLPFDIEVDVGSLLDKLEFSVESANMFFEEFFLPKKLTYIFQKENRPTVVEIISSDHGYEYDNSDPDFYCYFQTIEFNEKETLLEVKIAK